MIDVNEVLSGFQKHMGGDWVCAKVFRAYWSRIELFTRLILRICSLSSTPGFFSQMLSLRNYGFEE